MSSRRVIRWPAFLLIGRDEGRSRDLPSPETMASGPDNLDTSLDCLLERWPDRRLPKGQCDPVQCGGGEPARPTATTRGWPSGKPLQGRSTNAFTGGKSTIIYHGSYVSRPSRLVPHPPGVLSGFAWSSSFFHRSYITRLPNRHWPIRRERRGPVGSDGDGGGSRVGGDRIEKHAARFTVPALDVDLPSGGLLPTKGGTSHNRSRDSTLPSPRCATPR